MGRKQYFCACGAALLLSLATTVVAQTAQPNPCIRWAHSSTLGASTSNSSAESTLYIYGGDAKTTPGQSSGTRTNALVALDVSKNWSIAQPPLTLVKGDNGDSHSPPQTSLGAMWPNRDGTELFYYGGYFDDNPVVEPDANKLFSYSVSSGNWDVVQTSGDNIARVAEGAAALAPGNASAEPSFYYFGGHLDSFTTQGWSNQIDRVYLNSMIQYDQAASSWTNQTSYSGSGSSSANSTVETAPLLRADNTLTYVPGPDVGTNGQGILVSIGGGNANQLIDNSILDVYDIGAGGWVKQATQGYTIGPRVSHCAVRGSAKVNGQMQHQIFVYGGQASNRTQQIANGQNQDIYVLSIPSFTWTFVGNQLPSAPTGRAAQSCSLIGSQMVVVGGYISEDLICEQPGVYVFDTTSLSWKTQYTAGTVYTTPDNEEIASLAGGRGTGSSTSGSGFALGGTGADDEDTSASFPKSGGSGSGGGGSNTGAIAGGVVGGLAGLTIILGLLYFFWRKKKRQEREAAEAKEKEKLGLSTNTSPGSNLSNSNPYEEQMRQSMAADDDVEEATQGYNAQFSHLVPRQTLRVVNTD